VIANDTVHSVLIITIIRFTLVGISIQTKSFWVITHEFACFDSRISSLECSCMFVKSVFTNTTPLGFKLATLLRITFEWMWILCIVFQVWLLAIGASHVRRSLDRHLSELDTGALTHFTTVVTVIVQRWHVLSEPVAAKAFARRAHYFTIPAFRIDPVHILVLHGLVPVFQNFVLVFIQDFTFFISLNIDNNFVICLVIIQNWWIIYYYKFLVFKIKWHW